MTDNAIEPIAIHCPICGYHQVVPLAEWLFQSSDLGHGHTCGSGKCPSHTKMVACVKYQYNPCASRGEMYPANDHIADVSKMAPVLPPKPSEGASYAEKLAYDEALIASHRARPITDEHRPLNIIPVQLTKEQAEAAITSVVRGYFTPKSREQWDSLKRVGRWDTDLEALEGLRDDAAERLP